MISVLPEGAEFLRVVGWLESSEDSQSGEGPQGHRGQEGLCLQGFRRE